jgi:hypothetical protein
MGPHPGILLAHIAERGSAMSRGRRAPDGANMADHLAPFLGRQPVG